MVSVFHLSNDVDLESVDVQLRLWLIWEYCSSSALYRKPVPMQTHSTKFREEAGYAEKW